MNLVDDLITVSNSKFKEEDPQKLREYYDKAIKENRFIYLRNNGDVVGFLIYFIFDKEGIDEILKTDEKFKYPQHKPDGEYLYVDENVVFTGKKANYLPLRRFFKKTYPQLKKAYWDNIVTRGKRKKHLFEYEQKEIVNV